MRPFVVIDLPKLNELSSISASRFGAFKECLLRESCSAGRYQPLLPVAPKSVLGTVAHKVLELAAHGHFSLNRRSADDLWDDFLQEKEAKLLVDPVHEHLVPLKKSCTEYFLVKARTTQTATRLAHDGPSGSSAESAPRSIGPEIRVQSRDGSVKGSIDAVVYNDGELTFIDYKTGEIYCEDGGVLVVKPEYAIQLKLYAVLYNETFAKWPARLFLIGMHGQKAEIGFEKAECLSLLESVKSALAEANERIRSAIAARNADSLANPCPSACKFCRLRPACTAYCRARYDSADSEWPSDIWGKIESLNTSSTGFVAVRLIDTTTEGGTAVVRRLSKKRFVFFEQVQSGWRLAAYSLRKESSSHTYCETPMSGIFATSGELADGG